VHRTFLIRFVYLLLLVLTLSAKSPLDYEDGFCINCHNVDATTLAKKWSKDEWKFLNEDITPLLEVHKASKEVIEYLHSFEFNNELPTFVNYMSNNGNEKLTIVLKQEKILFKYVAIEATKEEARFFFKKIINGLKSSTKNKQLTFELKQIYSEVSSTEAIFRVLFFITPMKILHHWKLTVTIESQKFEIEGTIDEFDFIFDKLLKSSRILI